MDLVSLVPSELTNVKVVVVEKLEDAVAFDNKGRNLKYNVLIIREHGINKIM
jgi:hypothetical protein